MNPLELDIYVTKLPCACAPGKMDRRTAAFNMLLLELKKARRERFVFAIHALNLHFQRFKDNPFLRRILQDEGHDALPVILLGGAPVFKGAFPGREALEDALDRAAGALHDCS